MSSNKDSQIADLMKQLEIKNQQLLQQKVQIQNNMNLYLSKNLNHDDSFLIYSSDFDEEVINIIGRHLEEFSELVYDHNYLLIIRKEINRNMGVYLMAFSNDCQLGTTMEAIDQLVERKREENADQSTWHTRRIVPEVKVMTMEMKELNDKVARLTSQLEQSQTEKESMAKRIQLLEKINEDMKNYKEKTTNLLEAIHKTTQQTYKNLNDKERIADIKKKRVYVEERRKFYQQSNLEYIKNSPYILGKMCERLSTQSYVDKCSPPFKDVKTMEEKQTELISYFDLLQQDLAGYSHETSIQTKLKIWFEKNSSQLLSRLNIRVKEQLESDMLKCYGWHETIGTAHYIPLQWRAFITSTWFICLAITNCRVTEWDCGLTEATLGEHLTKVGWDEKYKLATDLEVDEKAKKYFNRVSKNEFEKIKDHHQIVEWFFNNFDSLKSPFTDKYYCSFPGIYNMALQYFEESMQ